MYAHIIRACLAALLALAGCRAFDNDSPPVRYRFDGDGQGGGDPGAGTPLTIYDIQDPSSPNHVADGDPVRLEGVIVSGLASDHFWIIEPAGGEYSGIYVYNPDSVAPGSLAVGDQVTLVGAVAEYNGLTEVSLATDAAPDAAVTVTGSGQKVPILQVPAAEIGTIATGGTRAEALEGVLVEINGTVTVSELLLYGELLVSNGTDTLRVDDLAWPAAEEGLVTGQDLTLLRGLLHYSFDNFKLEPRDANDLTAGPLPPVPATIYQIQDRNSLIPVAPETLVRIENMVVTAVQEPTGSFVVQVPEAGQHPGYGASFSAIACERAVDAGNTVVARGDLVNVEGIYMEDPPWLNAMSQIQVTLVESVGTALVPAPILVAATEIGAGAFLAEQWESVLMRVDDVTLSDPTPDSTDYGEFEVAGVLRVDDEFYDDAEVEGRLALAGFEYIIGPLYWSLGNFKLEPRDASDMRAWPISARLVDVYQIQDRDHADPALPDEVVRVENVVVTGARGAGDGAFFVQIADANRDKTYGAAFSGIYVNRAQGATPRVAQGDVVNIEGAYSEKSGQSQIAPAVVDVVSTGALPPTPEVVAAADIGTGGTEAETYEGVVVRVENVAVTNPSLGYGEFELDGVLRGDDLLYDDAETLAGAAPSGFASITGPLAFSFGNTKIAPRRAADMIRAAITPAAATTYQIQDRAHPSVVAEDTDVELTALVVTAIAGAGNDDFVAQIAEADQDGTYGATYSGLWVNRTLGDTPVVAVGDVVTIAGIYREAYSNSEILATQVTVTGPGGGVVPPATVVAAGDATEGTDGELYEGVLIEVQNVALSNPNPDDPDDNGEFEVDGLRVDDLLYPDAEVDSRTNTSGFASITGIHYYSHQSFKLLPRDAADIVSN